MHKDYLGTPHLFIALTKLDGGCTQDALRTLNVPTLWLTGDEDIVYPPFLSDILAKLMPDARAARVAQAGHSVYFERPGEFNRIVDEFLGANP